MIGTTIGKYRILEKLGQGGMGAVYRAEDTRLGRQVALKLLPPEVTKGGEMRARMLDEARAAARIDHPAICTLFEFDEADGTPFLAMQLVEGESLRDALERGPLDEERVRAIVAAVGAALSAAHARNILHRDVKPENILLGADGSIKLADFGLALLGGDTRLTRDGSSVGTPYVMAPEQITSNAATPASDQFGLGVVAYECLTGMPPFRGDTLPALMHAVLHDSPEAPCRRREGVSPLWDGILLRALEKDQEARFESVAAFASAVASTGARPEASVPAGPPRSLAVLYFDNLSSDPDTDYFCAGITEDLLTDLSKLPGLGVASRNAVGRYRGKSVDIPRVAAELGVATVLEGSVRKAGNRVRINAQLIDASNGMHLWAERYDRTLDDVFAVQDDITSSIAAALRATLRGEAPSALHASRPGDVRAYDIYLRGRAYYDRYVQEEMHLAIECFEEAVRFDPDYALAWAGIADACAQMADKGWDLDRKWLIRGEAAARRAVELAPELPETHKALAIVLSTQGRAAESRRHLHAALEADPRFVPAIVNLGSLRMEDGDFAGTERCLRRSVQLDPTHPFELALLSHVCYATGRNDEVLALSRTIERWGGGSKSMRMVAQYMQLLISLRAGRIQGARDALAGLQRAGWREDLLHVAGLWVESAAGASALELPPIPDTGFMYYTSDLHFRAALHAGDADHAARALRHGQAVDPHSWTTVPAYARATLELTPAIRHSAPMREWFADRGRSIIWPAEAPPLPDDIRADFDEYRVETGIPPEEGIP